MLYPEPEEEEPESGEEESAWITIPQAVHIIGCNKSSIYRWINNDKLKNRGRRVRKADVLGLTEESRKIKKGNLNEDKKVFHSRKAERFVSVFGCGKNHR